MTTPRTKRWRRYSAIFFALLIGTTIYFLSAGRRSVTAALRAVDYDDAVEAVDRLYLEHPPQPPKINIHRSPAVLAGVAPTISLRDEGAYLQTHSFFVEEDGIFILRSDSTFDPTTSGDPHFEHVRGRLFRYHISG